MTEYSVGPHTFHLGNGECVLLTGKEGCRQLLKELGRRPACWVSSPDANGKKWMPLIGSSSV